MTVFRRMFFAMVGLGAGVTLGAVAVRSVERTRQKLTPEALAATAGKRASGLRDRLAAAVAKGREAMAGREAELRAEHGVARNSD